MGKKKGLINGREAMVIGIIVAMIVIFSALYIGLASLYCRNCYLGNRIWRYQV